jgi:molybdopterin-guanine dinucleotide biosynthesis protein A
MASLPAEEALSGIAEDAACGFVLAGGRSSRMGRDKALVELQGRPLLEIALATLRAAGLPARIAGRRTPFAGPNPVIPNQLPEPIPDLIPESGPLGGIHAALSASTARWNLFLPVDMPLMPPSLLRCLLDRAELTAAPVTVVLLNGRLEPLPVVLDRAILPHLAALLARGQRACRTAWQSIPESFGAALNAPAVETLRALGHCGDSRGLPPVHWFQSANTPADLAFLHRLTDRISDRGSAHVL